MSGILSDPNASDHFPEPEPHSDLCPYCGNGTATDITGTAWCVICGQKVGEANALS